MRDTGHAQSALAEVLVRVAGLEKHKLSSDPHKDTAVQGPEGHRGRAVRRQTCIQRRGQDEKSKPRKRNTNRKKKMA